MIAQVAPTTIMIPARMKMEKFVFRSPSSHWPIGRTNQATRPTPPVVRARPVGHAEPARDRDKTEDDHGDTEPERDLVLLPDAHHGHEQAGGESYGGKDPAPLPRLGVRRLRDS